MANHVRVGLVGTSWWSDLHHLPSLTSHPRAEITAICGRNHDRAAELAGKYSIPHVFTDYRNMFASGVLDAVIVATPDVLHYPITMAALDTGLHVMCEKPLALSAVHAREMYQTAEARGLKHMVLFTWRWVPHFHYLRQLIQQGYIGRCYHCHLRWAAGYGREAQYLWKFDRQQGNGVLGDLGSHLVDFARWYIGDIAKVSGHLATSVQRPGPAGAALDAANDTALVAVEFANGTQGSIHVSAVSHLGDRGGEIQMAFYGEAGSLEADFSFSGAEPQLRGVRKDSEQWEVIEVPGNPARGGDGAGPFIERLSEIFHTQPVGDRLFVDAILEDRRVSPSFYEGWKVQEVIDAAITSHEQGRWIALA